MLRSFLAALANLILSVLLTALMTAPIWLSWTLETHAGELHPPMTYLVRDGALRLEVNPEVIASLKRQGWQETPRPQQHPFGHRPR